MAKLFSNCLFCVLLYLELGTFVFAQTTTTTTTQTTTTLTTTTASTSTTTTPTTTTTLSSTTSTTTPTTTTCVTTTTAYPSTPISLMSDPFTWKPPNFAGDCGTSPVEDGYDVIVQVDDGYSISVTVSDVDLADDNYFLIEGGDLHKDDATDGRVFANQVKGPLKYLFQTTSVYAYYQLNCTSCDNKFTVKFEKTGEPVTTIPTTTVTEISWPPTAPQDSVYITVNVSGRTPKEYTNQNTIDAFKVCVVAMANSYCRGQNIILEENITNANVIITNIDQCPYSWPYSESCVQIRFKLPIYYNETSQKTGYMLNSGHLEVMWLRYADGECFSSNKFSVYSEPDIDKSITWYAVCISLVIAIFIILLWLLRTLSLRYKTALFRSRMRRGSDSESIISKKKDSVISLAPHYLQDHMDTPKFFET